MMGLVMYTLIWGAMILLTMMEFWIFMFISSILFLMTLFFSPLITGMTFLGHELMIDTLSFSLVTLSVWVVILMVKCSYKIFKEKSMEIYFIFLLMILLFTLIMTFTVANYLGLYIFFEASLLPTLLIIVGWGYQIERLQAGIYFLFYTVVSSLPLLVLILSNYSVEGSLFMEEEIMKDPTWGYLFETIKFIVLISAFLVKMPMFFVHLWLPKAHVEAPVSGSMILAGVLLKLGGYGLCRVMSGFSLIMLKMSNLLVSLGLVSMAVVGFICCRLNDMKALVAYSSVAHMGLVIAGLYIGGVLGFSGALILMVGHGVASSGLFCILNMFYERTGSRSFYMNKGMILILPMFSFFMFMLCASNMGAPPSINLLSELYLLGSLMGYSWWILLIFPLGSFMGVVFTIYLFSYSQHGKVKSSLFGYWDMYMVELNSLMMHIVPLNVMILKFDLFLLWL